MQNKIDPAAPTLHQARQYLHENWEKPEGVSCPCCGQKVKIYKRTINHSIAAMLIKLYKLTRLTNDYVHIKDLYLDGRRGSDFGILKHRGLITQKDNDDPKKKTSGYWRLTAKGQRFVEGREVQQKYISLYNNHFYGYSGPYISIVDCLGEYFDYRELMGYSHA